jgi:hypothetical protein
MGLTFQEFRAWRVFCGGKKAKPCECVCVFNPGFCGNLVCLRTKMCAFCKFCTCKNFDEASCCERGVARFWVVVERV